MKQLMIKSAGLLLWAALYGVAAQAQEWKKDFPEAEAAYTNLSCEVNIKWNEGALTATTSFTEDLLLASDNAVKMMSRGHIYHSSFSELKKWEAYTQLPESKKLKVSNTSTGSSRSDFIFYDDAKTTSFDFSGVTVGATRHLEYNLEHKDLHLLMPFYFERYFPVINGELRVVFPSSVKMKYIIKGLNADKIRFTESVKRDKTVYTFTAASLPSGQYYEDAPDNAYYATHIIFYIDQTEQDGVWKNFLSGIDDLYQYNYNYIKNVNRNTSPELQHLADSLTKGLGSDTEKAKKIYRWVQSHIKYVAFENGLEGFIPREASLVCSRRFGDCKDMASILTAMLNHAKVPAYFTWIGTRHLPYKYSETPLPLVDNHMICAVKLDDRFVFLDGTDDGCIFGMPSRGIQGKEALVAISDKEYKVVPVEVPSRQKNTYTDSTVLEFGETGLKGKLKVRMTGYFSSGMYSALNYHNEKERSDYFKGYFSRGSNKVKFSNWKIEQSEDKNETLVTADMELPDYAKKIGGEWLLNMNLFRFYEHKEIDYPKRKTPIEQSFLQSAVYTTVIKVPQGFTVSYLPKSQNYQNDVWGFDMQYAASKDMVALTQKFDTGNLMLYPAQFEQWNKVLENLFPHYKQSVVLNKN